MQQQQMRGLNGIISVGQGMNATGSSNNNNN
jgi:hypothetical protein